MGFRTCGNTFIPFVYYSQSCLYEGQREVVLSPSELAFLYYRIIPILTEGWLRLSPMVGVASLLTYGFAGFVGFAIPATVTTFQNVVNCVHVRYAVNDECHLYKSTTFSPDTCKHIGGTYVAANRTCYYHEYSCRYHNIGGQCHRYRSCGRHSCDTCRIFGGHYVANTHW